MIMSRPAAESHPTSTAGPRSPEPRTSTRYAILPRPLKIVDPVGATVAWKITSVALVPEKENVRSGYSCVDWVRAQVYVSSFRAPPAVSKRVPIAVATASYSRYLHATPAAPGGQETTPWSAALSLQPARTAAPAR